MKTLSLFVLLFIMTTSKILADHKLPKPDSHAPIGVMGDHLHLSDEYMISYRFMKMSMEELINNGNKINNTNSLSLTNSRTGQTYRILPKEMNMEMHMLGGMYAPSDNLTIMLMTNYIKKKMSHTTYNMGGTAVVGEFEAETKGIGDTSITAMINSESIFNIKSHVNIGLSLPTGSVTETVEVLMPNSSRPTIRAPYGMQLGSGTYDLKGAFTINKDFENFGMGLQSNYKTALNEQNGWSFGNYFDITSWTSFLINEKISIAGRLKYYNQEEIDGRDNSISGRNPTQDTKNYGGDGFDLSLSLNLLGQNSYLKGHRLAIEYTLPIKQDNNGLQMKKTNSIIIGYQKAF